jgi:hypothetical protein
MKRNATQYRDLSKNYFFYRYFIENKILNEISSLNDEEILNRIKHLAEFAYFHHTGLFYDGRMENILVEYGLKLEDYISSFHRNQPDFTVYETSTIIHVASEIAAVGGHTRILSQMIDRIKDKDQLLFLTNQQSNTIPEWFIKKHSKNLKIITYESIERLQTYFDKAIILRRLSQNCEKIILYHHPFDIIPVLAFSNEKCPVVLLENHAHSWFWFGLSIADIVFSHTLFHTELTSKYRTPKNNFYLPFSQFEDQNFNFDFNDKLEAKKRLNIPDEYVCITAIGTSQKFFPLSDKYNFFRLANKIIERFSNVVILVIGLDDNIKEISKYKIDIDKVRFVGYQSDITDYYMASDICIDSIPEPSLGATIMANWAGMSCPLFKYGGSGVFDAIKMFPNDKYDQIIGHIKDEDEYIEKLGILINNYNLRLEIAETFRKDLFEDFDGNVIRNKCKEMFEFAETLTHLTTKINECQVFYDSWNEEIAMSNSLSIFLSLKYFKEYLSNKDIIKINLYFLKFRKLRSETYNAIFEFIKVIVLKRTNYFFNYLFKK